MLRTIKHTLETFSTMEFLLGIVTTLVATSYVATTTATVAASTYYVATTTATVAASTYYVATTTATVAASTYYVATTTATVAASTSTTMATATATVAASTYYVATTTATVAASTSTTMATATVTATPDSLHNSIKTTTPTLTTNPSVSSPPSPSLPTSNPSTSNSSKPTFFNWFLVILMALVILTTMVGNVLVIVSVFTHKPLRSVQNFYIVSLALSDFMLALVVMPFHVIYWLLGKWVMGKAMCFIWVTCDVSMCTASILNLCAIAIDRYVVVVRCG